MVNGTAILKQIPETITANISVKAKDDKFSECQGKLVKAIDQAKNLLVKSGIDEEIIHTFDLNVSERRDYLANNQVKLSFEGSASISVEHIYSVEYAQKLLSAIQNETVTLLYSLNFTLSENQKKELRQKAIDLAMSDAKEKAEAIAKAGGFKLVKINMITFTDNEMGGFESDLVQEGRLNSGYIAIAKAATAPAIDFNPKEIGIKKSITVEWLIEEKK